MTNIGANNTSVTDNATVFCPFQADVTTSKIIQALLYMFLALLAVLGNLLIVAVVYKSLHMRTSINYFIAVMSICDTLLPLTSTPRIMFRLFYGNEWFTDGPGGLALCKLLPFTQEALVSLSVLIMVAIAIERLCAVVFPLRGVITARVARTMIGVGLLTTLTLRLPMVYTLQLATTHQGETFCHINLLSEAAEFIYFQVSFVTFYALPLCVLIVLYSVVIVKLQRRKNGFGRSFGNRYCIRVYKKNKQAVTMMVVVVIVFGMCWFLYFLTPLIYTRHHDLSCDLSLISIILGHANAAVTPIIYFVFSNNYRQGFKSICRCQRVHSKRRKALRKRQVVIPLNITSIELQSRQK